MLRFFACWTPTGLCASLLAAPSALPLNSQLHLICTYSVQLTNTPAFFNFIHSYVCTEDPKIQLQLQIYLLVPSQTPP